MDRRMGCVDRAATIGVCSVILLVFLLGTSRPVEGLRCRTGEGPSTEDVKRIVRTCLNKVTNSGSENRTSDEYPDYDSSTSDETNEEKDSNDGRQGANNKQGTKPSYYDRRYDGTERGNGRMNGRPEESGRRQQMDRRDQRNGEDRNGRTKMSDRGRDRNEEEQQMMRDYGRSYRRRKRQYYGGQGTSSGSGGEYTSYGRPPPQFGETVTGNGSRGGNSSSIERDRACLMQCFFEELKATNADGFPEKHKVLHVITKDIREHELREFYIDSIQECFHVLALDNRLKDKCDYSMRFVTCLSDRFESNCDDWDTVTSAMF
ncbi:general odorant-binding protein 71 [Anopheles funestus]|uniref:general odorant-binding protein 71 n=1 Tax=Anopheles funestus TaxID=62324 RepID=UPI0020C6B2FD|nr:general odorant-binding protein 71 [Anopheles funestus]